MLSIQLRTLSFEMHFAFVLCAQITSLEYQKHGEFGNSENLRFNT